MRHQITLVLALTTFLCTCTFGGLSNHVRAQTPLDTSRQMDRDVWFLGADEFEGITIRSGIRFTDDGPSSYDGVRLNINLSKGSAMLTDPGNGEVKAYTNGQVIVDASHRVMPGGENLEGVPRQNGALFIPDPTSCQRWRILHQGAGFEVRNYNAYYAEFDLGLPGNGSTAAPLGEVTLNSRRIFSSTYNDAISEGMNAILKSPDSRESWVFMTSKGQREFVVLNSDANGISVHQRYSLDTLFPNAFENFDRVERNSVEYYEDEAGQGRLLIAVEARGDNTEDDSCDNFIGIIGFDRNAGELLEVEVNVVVTEPTIFNLVDAIFSPDGTKMYWINTSNSVASFDFSTLLGTYTLKQYDFITDEITLLESVVEVEILETDAVYNQNLALGPDGKIYHPQFPQFSGGITRQNLSAVSQPNAPGINSDYQLTDFPFGRIAPGTPVLPSFAVQPHAPEIRAAYEQISCDSVEYLLSATTPPWGEAPFTFRWNTGETTTEIVTTQTGRYNITVTDANGCEQYAILELEPVELEDLRQAPDIRLIGSNCPGSSVLLTATPPASIGQVSAFSWVTPGGNTLNGDTVSIANISVAETGRYQASYLDINGCPSPLDSFILEIAPTDFSLGLDTIVCDTAYTFGIAGQLEDINWNTGDTNARITVDSSGIYGFVALTPKGCIVSDSVEVRIQRVISSVLPDTSIVFECEEAIITTNLPVGALTDYRWSSVIQVCESCPEPRVRGEKEGYITLSATTFASGCPVRDSTYLSILRSYDVYVPNAFSPNGDGINDQFIAYTKSPEAIIEQFIVYDRWGGEVFSAVEIPANDPALGWDGGKGQPSDTNTYAYYLRLRFADGRRREVKGAVQLLR